MITQTKDPYYSRTSDTWETAPRLDPTASDAPGPLTTDEVWNYAHNGFLFANSLFSEDEVQNLLTEAHTLIESWPESQPGIVREPDSNVVRSIFRLHQYSDIFKKLFADKRLLDRARQLIGTDVYIHQSRVNYKPAMNGKEFFWHSDFETWHVEDGMPRMRALSVSIFLTESHEFNGPLMLIPGSHEKFIRCAGETPEKNYEKSLRRQEYGVPTREALETLLEDREIVAPKGPAGSVVFFDCNTMHGSNGNLSPTPRNNLFAVYNSVENQLVEPFCDRPPRPDYLAERNVERIES
ncbi:ectoine hydroxylase [Rubinisphaera italica]|uniref:Ectoine hydroxylase n=1 Tax=Rubinisphaera italica TaxID=2527969 RepID=A0A5C5XEG9_9PLAN|nr:ectoine hydroxylase [Rubinisphaera italica]TWT60713.1 Phytanoyl-CoA dioxygenase (PhyH) [Rubinisphaera italica]